MIKHHSQTLGTLYFSKKFLTGMLKGLIVPCSLTGVTDATVQAYRIGSKGKDYMTGAKWIIVDASFQNYVRS